jgi:hypothetical protein
MSVDDEKQLATGTSDVLESALDESNLRGVLRSWRALILSLISSVVLLILFSWLAEEVFEGDMRRFDSAVRLKVHQIFSPRMTSFMQAMSFLGSVKFLLSLFVVITAFWII